MKTYIHTLKGSRFAGVSEGLMLLLFVASFLQIGACVDAGRLLMTNTVPVLGTALGPVLGTNAPMVGGSHSTPAPKSPGFPSGASRG
jgi:hypothetical protein